jgi:glycosyltransferase involved in cell wall biosynthesis
MPEPLLIGQFNDSYAPVMDGVGICAENYTRWISAQHGTGIAVVPRQPGYEDSDEFRVLRFASLPFLPMRPYRLGVPWMSPSVGAKLRKMPFDLVHSHTPFVGGRMAKRIADHLHIPHVSTFHTKYRDDALKVLRTERLADEVVRRIVGFYHKVDAVWTPSESTADTLREYGFDGKVTVAPNGSDMPIPTDVERAQLRRGGEELCGLRPQEFMFLFVGQHRWEKNVRLIIQAVARLVDLARKDPGIARFKLVFAGEGYAAPAMRELSADLGIGNEVLFLGRIVERTALRSLFARADLLLFPSMYDNAPLVMREAAAYGLPTVVAAGSTTADIVRDGENGFVTENDPDHLFHRLRTLMGQPELRRRAGAGAVRSIYRSWEDIVGWAVDQYREIIDGFV